MMISSKKVIYQKDQTQFIGFSNKQLSLQVSVHVFEKSAELIDYVSTRETELRSILPIYVTKQKRWESKHLAFILEELTTHQPEDVTDSLKKRIERTVERLSDWYCYTNLK